MTAYVVDLAGSIRAENRRARRRGLVADLTMGEWMQTLEHFKGLCAYCGERPYECLDHVTPLSKGGGTTRGNCLPACKTCNLKKGNRLWSDHPALAYFGIDQPPPPVVCMADVSDKDSIMLSQTALTLRNQLSEKFGISKTAVFELAIHELATQWGYFKSSHSPTVGSLIDSRRSAPSQAHGRSSH